jgi:flavin-dependent dehydrogenase
MKQRVEIYGAGLAGCMTAIHLARAGLEVHLYDRERRPGGNLAWHPSVQTTVLDALATWNFIGLDLSNWFQPVGKVTFYRYGRKDHLHIPNFYVVERGPRESSLDAQMNRLAMESGAVIHRCQELNERALSATGKVVLACGLDPDAYHQLGIPAEPIYGYRAVMRSNRDRELLTYMLPCTHHDFAYLAAANGLLFALLFSRKYLLESSLDEFTTVLQQTENIRMPRWMASSGAVATHPRLWWRGHILAGSLAGSIDPFLLHGVSGALVSGYLAALAVLDPPAAEKLFQRVTRNHARKRVLKQIASLSPFKRFSMPFFMWLDSQLAGVGFVYKKEEGSYASATTL